MENSLDWHGKAPNKARYEERHGTAREGDLTMAIR